MHRDLGELHNELCQGKACDQTKLRRSMRYEKASLTLLYSFLPCYIQLCHMRMQGKTTHEPMLLSPNIVIMY